ncbi:dihydrolipoyl dehydrogenase family protein [Pseudactinotalea sp. Z1732]|uniref:dihydrolipoyl dehydrogenase family protein n=1 Tax=Pseudactinotalea sp. Z1732 TaxID=3413026 RepID=UPI003C7AD0A1
MPEHRTYDVVVIGAGPVGENAADRAARSGLSVAVVEHELVGGECSYWACMPSKALLRPGAALAAARSVPGATEAITGGVDVRAALAGRDEFTQHWDDAAHVQWLADAGLDLVRGHGSIDGVRRVRVGGSGGADDLILQANHAVVVATGSGPFVPDLPGLRSAGPWTNREVTELREVPDSVAVIGGGVVAAEMATALADLGCQVTMLVRGGRLLSGTEPFAGAAVAESLGAMGVRVHLDTSVTGVQRTDDGVLLDTDAAGRVRAAEVLVATGRRPRTGGLGLDSIGLAEHETLATDETGRVRRIEGDWLYAAGDVTGATHTTHQGKYVARVVGDVIAHRFGAAEPSGAGSDAEPVAPWSPLRARSAGAGEPQVIFTRPEVAAVGYTEEQAQRAGLTTEVVTVGMDQVAGASLAGAGQAAGSGAARLVIDPERRVVVGATFVGPAASDLLHAATIAVVGQVGLDRLWHAVPAFPTISEVWLRLLEEYGL